MNLRQQRFADNVLAGKTGVQSAIEAGYSKDSAYVQSSCLLRNAKVRAYIDQKRSVAGEKVDVTLEWTLRKLAEEAQHAPDAKDRVRALELLIKAQGGFVERSEVSVHGDAMIIAARAETLMKKVMEADDHTTGPALLPDHDHDTDDTGS